MRRALLALLTLGLLGVTASPAVAVAPGSFSRMFGDLPALTKTDTQIRDLAQTMLEVQALGQADNNSSFVQGQFLDHDFTRDEEPSPTAPVNLKSLDNVRNPNLDLDSVYGDGPTADPQLYDGARLKVGVSNGHPDLPRNPDGSAIVGDGRNDENLIIAQFHAAVLRFHNRLVDQSMSFAQAQRTTQHQWQWLVLNEYLPRFVGDVARIPNRYQPGNKHDPVTPVEDAVACFRFGHSQVRNAYNLNTNGVNRVVFSFDPNANTLLGGRPIPANARIEWARFFDIGGVISAARNNGRLVDTNISPPLFALPIPSVVAGGGSNVLAFRNMVRGVHYGLPSYESVARALGHTPVNVASVVGDLPAGFEDGTPLFFGALAESEALGGARLGPTCGRIVNEVFRTNVERDPNSYLNAKGGFVPLVRTTGDFLAYAGVTGGPF